MRWTSVICLCVLAAHWAHSYPVESDKQETLSTLEESIGHPTAEHTDREKRTIGVLRQIFPELSKSSRRRRAAEDQDPAESEKTEVRVPVVSDNDKKAADKEDIEGAESSNEEVTNDADDDDDSSSAARPKRLGVLGSLFGGGRDSGSGSGSGGGSGNFLFDIIRRATDGAARAAGTVYRMVAGTDTESVTARGTRQDDSGSRELDSLELDAAAATSPTVTTPILTTLVAGSGATEQQDEAANAPLAPGQDGGSGAPSDDGYQAGIPGPITRLFVIANRGIANLLQDLILRLAQTSERIVNFKARLITAII